MPIINRAPYWRLLDTVGGAAIGLLLALAVLWLHTLASPAATAQPPETWQDGPWPGCTLVSMTSSDETDGQNTVSHRVNATWACASAMPPALMTPSPSPRP